MPRRTASDDYPILADWASKAQRPATDWAVRALDEIDRLRAQVDRLYELCEMHGQRWCGEYKTDSPDDPAEGQ